MLGAGGRGAAGVRCAAADDAGAGAGAEGRAAVMDLRLTMRMRVTSGRKALREGRAMQINLDCRRGPRTGRGPGR